MGVIETTSNINHPDGKIVLVNGTVLDCEKKQISVDEISDDSMKLDDTGEFLIIGEKKPKKNTDKAKKSVDVEFEMQKDFFLKHALFLYEHRDKVLADSKMFLTPIPLRCGLAYTGHSGFMNPTLGIWLEWLENCKGSVMHDKNGNTKLLFHLAGSPLSGMNSCATVDASGNVEQYQCHPFKDYWVPFTRINTRYTEAKILYESYDLEAVVKILEGVC